MTIFVEDKLKPGVVGTKLADGVDVELTAPSGTGNLDSAVTNLQLLANAVDTLATATGSQYSSLLAALLGGASVSTDHVDDRVEIAEGYGYGVDYRDNAEGDVNDDDHYNTAGVTITGNNAANTFTSSNWSDHSMLIGLYLDIDSSRTNDGAMIVKYGTDAVTEHDFLHIGLDRRIIVRTDPTDSDTEVAFQDVLGDIVLSNTSSYWILLSIFTNPSGGYRMTPVIMEVPDANPSNVALTEANDIDLDLSNSSPNVLGLSRSTTQVGRIDEFKIIRQTSFKSHAELATLLREHTDDKWCFGFARLFEGSDTEEVSLVTQLNLADGSAVNGNAISIDKPEVVVHLSTEVRGGTADLVSTVTLPENYEDYNYVHVTEYDATSLQWRHAIIPTEPLGKANVVGVNDSIRLQGNSVMDWNRDTRMLSLVGNAVEIYRVALRD